MHVRKYMTVGDFDSVISQINARRNVGPKYVWIKKHLQPQAFDLFPSRKCRLHFAVVSHTGSVCSCPVECGMAAYMCSLMVRTPWGAARLYHWPQEAVLFNLSPLCQWAGRGAASSSVLHSVHWYLVFSCWGQDRDHKLTLWLYSPTLEPSVYLVC